MFCFSVRDSDCEIQVLWLVHPAWAVKELSPLFQDGQCWSLLHPEQPLWGGHDSSCKLEGEMRGCTGFTALALSQFFFMQQGQNSIKVLWWYSHRYTDNWSLITSKNGTLSIFKVPELLYMCNLISCVYWIRKETGILGTKSKAWIRLYK